MFAIFLQLAAAFLGTFSFAIIFKTPSKYYVACGLIGTIGWGVYLLIMAAMHSLFAASLISSFVLIILSRFAAYNLKGPVTIFLVCGIFCIVPGIGIYNVAHNFVSNDFNQAFTNGISVLKVCLAMTLGIAFGYELPAKLFIKLKK